MLPILPRTGSIIWIPQLYLNYKLKSYHQIFFQLIICKIPYFIVQIFSIPLFINTGLFSLVLKNYPAAVLGQLIHTFLFFAVFYQIRFYDRNSDFVHEEEQEDEQLYEGGWTDWVANETQPDLSFDQVSNSDSGVESESKVDMFNRNLLRQNDWKNKNSFN